jgi:hypothetical protein
MVASMKNQTFRLASLASIMILSSGKMVLPSIGAESKQHYAPLNRYINKSGKVVVKSPRKIESYDFHEGLALMRGDSASFINRYGKIAMADEYVC